MTIQSRRRNGRRDVSLLGRLQRQHERLMGHHRGVEMEGPAEGRRRRGDDVATDCTEGSEDDPDLTRALQAAEARVTGLTDERDELARKLAELTDFVRAREAGGETAGEAVRPHAVPVFVVRSVVGDGLDPGPKGYRALGIVFLRAGLMGLVGDCQVYNSESQRQYQPIVDQILAQQRDPALVLQVRDGAGEFRLRRASSQQNDVPVVYRP
jgi:hypothetical protein